LERRLLLYNTYVGQGDNDAKWTNYDLSYSFTNALDGGLQPASVTQIRTAVAEAFAMWAAVSPLKFTEQIDPNPSLVTDETYDGDGLPTIRIGQHNIDGPVGSGGSLLAHAQRPGDNGRCGLISARRWRFGATATFCDRANDSLCALQELNPAPLRETPRRKCAFECSRLRRDRDAGVATT
jgi:hypothetical protein